MIEEKIHITHEEPEEEKQYNDEHTRFFVGLINGLALSVLFWALLIYSAMQTIF